MASFEFRISTNELTRIVLALEADGSVEALDTLATLTVQRHERSNNYGSGHYGDETGHDGKSYETVETRETVTRALDRAEDAKTARPSIMDLARAHAAANGVIAPETCPVHGPGCDGWE